MRLPFVKETWSMVVPTLLVGIALLGLGKYFGVGWLLFAAILILEAAVLMLNFFRDFERSPNRQLEANEVISPADGRIVVFGEGIEIFYLKKRVFHIAIFMNPLNNHVQRAPMDGRVIKKVYHPGEFLAAYDDKADLKNEQAHLVLETSGRKKIKIVLKQIAGFLCRRVKTDVEVGENLKRGGRFGRILLGSRVDLFLPLEFIPAVKLGDQVMAGMTVLGKIK